MTGSSKQIEYERYNSKSLQQLQTNAQSQSVIGPESLPVILRDPYVEYERAILSFTNGNSKVLDICCGDGSLSVIAAKNGATVVISDIAENSVELAIKKAKEHGFKITGVAADAEKLPFDDASFDVVTCSGSISYVDLEIFLKEIQRVLKPGGHFICVDSFNHNIFYRVNRFMHYLKGNRSWQVNQRIPSDKTIQTFRSYFKDVLVKYFGIFIFFAPFIKIFVGEEKTAWVLRKLDQRLRFLYRYSFKIVIIASK